MATPGQVVGVGKLITPGGAQGPKGDPGSAIPLADTTQNGLLKKVSGLTTDFVDGTNNCQNLLTVALPQTRQYNAIRNPTLRVAQRGASGSASGYSLDGWLFGGGLAGAQWSQIVAAIPPDISGNQWYPYTAYAYRVTFTTGKPTLTAADACVLYQYIEGFLAEQLKGNPTSISLLVRATIPGTFAMALRDSATGYSYVTTGTIVSANTWTRIALPNVPIFPSAGNFPDGNVRCYDFLITPAIGSGHVSATANLNSWITGNFWGTTTQTNFAATANNTFDFTLVKHEPNPICTPFVPRGIQEEVVLNYRYLWYPGNFSYIGWIQNVNWTPEMGRITMPVPMRAVPTIMAGSIFSVSSGNAGSPALASASNSHVILYNNGASWTPAAWAAFNGGFTAEL
jgi:hypothetical protein